MPKQICAYCETPSQPAGPTPMEGVNLQPMHSIDSAGGVTFTSPKW